MYNQALADVRSTGAGSTCLYCTYIHVVLFTLDIDIKSISFYSVSLIANTLKQLEILF